MENNNNNGDLAKSACNRLLEVAADSFAEKGFDGTSVRIITSKAKCNVAAVNYHFGSKEKLYIEVFRHYMGKMIDVRIAAINKVMSQKNPEPTLEDLIRAFANAFIEPLIDKSHGPLFMKLMLCEMTNPHLPKKMFTKELAGPTLQSLGKGVAKLCPGLEQKKIVLSIISLISQLVHAVHINELIDVDSSAGIPAPNMTEMIDHIVEFSAAGIRAAIQEKTK